MVLPIPDTACPVLLLLPSPSTRENWLLWRGRSLAGIRQHNSVEISANDPRILPAVFTVALPSYTCTKSHL